MYNFILLFIIEIFVIIIAFLAFERDYFQPSFVVSSVFFISTLFCFININKWEIELNYLTVAYIASGLVAVLIVNWYFAKCRKTKISISEDYVIPLHSQKMKVIVLVDLLICILYLCEILRVGNGINSGVEETYIALIKEEVANGNSNFNMIIRQSSKFVFMSAYLSEYIVCSDIVFRKSPKKNIYLFYMPIILAVFLSILSGGRIAILRLFIGFCVILYVLYKNHSEWKGKIKLQSLVKIIVTIIILVYFFFMIRNIIKVNKSKFFLLLDYFSYYVGGSIQAFNLQIDNGAMPGKYFADSILTYVYQFLDKIHLVNYQSNVNSLGANMVYLGGNSNAATNVFTFWGRSYKEFGWGGMLIYSHIVFGIYSYVYNFKLKRRNIDYAYGKRLILYAYFFFVVVLAFFDDCIYICINPTNLVNVLLLLFLYFFYCKVTIII